MKAVLLTFENDKECWVPKSCIANDYISDDSIQDFKIKNWVLEKNGVM